MLTLAFLAFLSSEFLGDMPELTKEGFLVCYGFGSVYVSFFAMSDFEYVGHAC